jgi:prephenate dehydrogenase
MNEPDDFQHARVAILGLGLIGGSLALALRGKCSRLVGLDTDPQVAAQAQAMGVVEQASTLPEEVLPQADLLVLAAPVRGIIHILKQLPNWHPGSAVVMDVGSTKAEIMAAMQALPERFDPMGGHPMCGKEHGSLANAEEGLFRDAVFALTALPRTSPHARRLAGQLVQAVGANPLWLPADMHDRWVASTSHVPYLLANALAARTPAEAAALIGPGLRSTTRLAASSLSIIMDMLATNRPNVLAALRSLQAQLDDLATSLETSDWLRLQAALERGRSQYEQVIESRS